MLKERLSSFQRITVDVDGVVVMSPVSVIGSVNRKFGTSYLLEDIKTLGGIEERLIKDFNLTPEEAYQIWFDEETNLIAPPVKGAIRALQDLKLKGLEISFVTARPPLLREVTVEWFKRNLLFLECPIHMRVDQTLSGEQFKVKKIGEVRPDLHIDDSHQVALLLSEKGIKTLILSQNWNQETTFLRKNWPGVYRFIVSSKNGV